MLPSKKRFATKSTRRCFLKQSSLIATGCLGLPYLVPASVLGMDGKSAANERVNIGFIGAGGRANQLMDQIPGSAGQVVAVADCFLPRASESAKRRKVDWKVYQDYRRILDDKSIDAVFVPTTDHARVLLCIHACQAGKDVYAEKPLTLTIGEGRVLVNAARKYKRVFQVGSQQRTMEMNRFACEFVRNQGIGKLKTVLAVNYPGPGLYKDRSKDLPEQPIPEGLDWDAWQGQAESRPYHSALQYGWMGFRSYSGGEMTNWGAHGVDQIQWALGASQTGPVEIWPTSPGLNGSVRMRYADGIEVRFELPQGPMGGAIFVGEDAKIEINRNKFTTNPQDLIKNPPEPAVAQAWEGPGWTAKLHIQNWLDCVKTREKPNADVEIGHRSISVCHLANIARQIGRKIKWDPDKEIFPGDEEANGYLNRPRRKGYELPEVV